MDLHQKLISHWQEMGLLAPRGAPQPELSRFEVRYGVQFSIAPDFRDYLLRVNGMVQIGGQDSDEKGFAFWPLDQIRSVPEECATVKVAVPSVDEVDRYFAFADYFQWSWAYAISLSPNAPGRILQFGTRSPRIIASSFTHFVEAYLADSGQLYFNQGT